MMAEPDEAPFSLLSLEEDLTCSICLSTFDCPVTIPCGHNFCHDCLLNSWKDSYSCPQCRTLFATKPELKKNTVLSTVVETFRGRSTKSDAFPEESEPTEKDVVRCDACMEAEAAQTCLTCMASFCEEHLRPHLENPTFRLHQLSQPVGDLSEHICSDHHKLMEHFCTQHLRLICSLCLQQVHKGCSFTSPEEQRGLKQTEFREKLCFLDVKIEKTDSVVLQMNELQNRLKDAAEKRKAAFGAMYQQMREMLDHDERVAQHEVDCELEAGQAKLRDFARRFTENSERMQKAREEISHLMSQSQTPAFLQASFELPKVVKFDPYAPRVSLDSKRLTAAQTFAAALQENLIQILSEPFEARMPLIKPELNTAAPDKTQAPVSGPATAENAASQPEFSTLKSAEDRFRSRSKSPGRPPIQPFYQTIPIPIYIQSQPTWTPPPFAQSQGFSKGSPFFTGQKTKQDKRPPSAQGGHKHDGKGADFAKKDKPKHHPPSDKSAGHNPHPKAKKSDGGHQPPNKQDKRPPSAQGGHKPDGKGADFAKKDKPKNHPPSEKSAGHNPHPKNNPHPKSNPHSKKNK